MCHKCNASLAKEIKIFCELLAFSIKKVNIGQ